MQNINIIEEEIEALRAVKLGMPERESVIDAQITVLTDLLDDGDVEALGIDEGWDDPMVEAAAKAVSWLFEESDEQPAVSWLFEE